MIIRCDECNGNFDFNNKSINEKYLGAMITEWYFNCPHCNKKYLVSLFNNKSRAMLRKMESLRFEGKVMEADKIMLKHKEYVKRLNHGTHTEGE